MTTESGGFWHNSWLKYLKSDWKHHFLVFKPYIALSGYVNERHLTENHWKISKKSFGRIFFQQKKSSNGQRS
jgi:hypothetical protein